MGFPWEPEGLKLLQFRKAVCAAGRTSSSSFDAGRTSVLTGSICNLFWQHLVFPLLRDYGLCEGLLWVGSFLPSYRSCHLAQDIKAHVLPQSTDRSKVSLALGSRSPYRVETSVFWPIPGCLSIASDLCNLFMWKLIINKNVRQEKIGLYVALCLILLWLRQVDSTVLQRTYWRTFLMESLFFFPDLCERAAKSKIFFCSCLQ